MSREECEIQIRFRLSIVEAVINTGESRSSIRFYSIRAWKIDTTSADELMMIAFQKMEEHP